MFFIFYLTFVWSSTNALLAAAAPISPGRLARLSQSTDTLLESFVFWKGLLRTTDHGNRHKHWHSKTSFLAIRLLGFGAHRTELHDPAFGKSTWNAIEVRILP